MAYELPDIYEIAGANVTEIFAALYAHWSGGTSTKWRLDPGVTGHGAHGLVVERIDGAGAQHSLRKPSTTQINATTDVSASITASGNASTAPTGISATAACTELGLTSISTTTTEKAILLEFDDSFLLLICTTAGYHSHALVMGEEFAPSWGNASEWGMSGYVVMNIAGGGSSGYYHLRTGGTLAQNWTTMETNSQNYRRGSDIMGPSGLYVPDPVKAYLSGWSQAVFGQAKHLTWIYNARSPRTLYKDPSDRHVCVVGSTSSGLIQVSWDQDSPVTP